MTIIQASVNKLMEMRLGAEKSDIPDMPTEKYPGVAELFFVSSLSPSQV